MPHIEYETPWIGASASISEHVKDPHSSKCLTAGGLSRGGDANEASLEIVLNNNDWNWSTPYDGVKLRLWVAGVPAKEGSHTYSTSIETRLTFDEIKRLHGFFGYLLSQMGLLRLSPEDAKSAAEAHD